MFDELRSSRNLLYNLVRRDLTVRYKSTVLGFFWSFVKPLALTAVFYVVFDKVLRISLRDESGNPIPPDRIPFALHLLTGILAWTFFSGASAEGLGAILANANLIKKIRLPLGVFPLAVVCSHLVHFLLALLVLVVLLIFSGLPPTVGYLWLPFLIALQFILTLGFTMALAALNVFYRDVSSIWEVLSTAWFYATPIVYPVYMATDKLAHWGPDWLVWVFLANPLTPLLLAYRRVLIYAATDPATREIADGRLLASLALCTVLSFLLLWAGRRIFRRYAQHFADEL